MTENRHPFDRSYSMWKTIWSKGGKFRRLYDPDILRCILGEGGMLYYTPSGLTYTERKRSSDI
jgi:hypothetical protein